MTDLFVSRVLIKARELNVEWRAVDWSVPSSRWQRELETFFEGYRDVSVFREWLRVTYVKDFVAERAIVTFYDGGEWRSLAHALADFKKLFHLNCLCRSYPEYTSLTVSTHTHSKEIVPLIWGWWLSLSFLTSQDEWERTPRDIAERLDSEVASIVRGLPKVPELYRDVLVALEDKRDDLIRDVLIKANEDYVEWRENEDVWNEELDVFLKGKRGRQVLIVWQKVSPRKPEFFRDVLQRFWGQDAVVYGICIRSRKLGIVWAETANAWQNEVELFRTGVLGVEVFKHWLKIRYVEEKILNDRESRHVLQRALARAKNRSLLNVLVDSLTTAEVNAVRPSSLLVDFDDDSYDVAYSLEAELSQAMSTLSLDERFDISAPSAGRKVTQAMKLLE